MKKQTEPFNLFGQNSLIDSKEEASKILRDNSYYIFVASGILFILSLLSKTLKIEIGISINAILLISIFYFILAVGIRRFKSRIASILALTSFTYVVISRLLASDIGGTFFFSLLFLAASYRCVKASFYYHHKE